MLNVNKLLLSDALGDEQHLCLVAWHIAVPACTPGVVLVSFQYALLMNIETHPNIVELQYSMTARHIVEIISDKLLCVFIASSEIEAS